MLALGMVPSASPCPPKRQTPEGLNTLKAAPGIWKGAVSYMSETNSSVRPQNKTLSHRGHRWAPLRGILLVWTQRVPLPLLEGQLLTLPTPVPFPQRSSHPVNYAWPLRAWSAISKNRLGGQGAFIPSAPCPRELLVTALFMHFIPFSFGVVYRWDYHPNHPYIDKNWKNLSNVSFPLLYWAEKGAGNVPLPFGLAFPRYSPMSGEAVPASYIPGPQCRGSGWQGGWAIAISQLCGLNQL